MSMQVNGKETKMLCLLLANQGLYVISSAMTMISALLKNTMISNSVDFFDDHEGK